MPSPRLEPGGHHGPLVARARVGPDDDIPDMMSAGRAVTVCLGTGFVAPGGSAIGPPTSLGLQEARDVQVADFDGDGVPDLAVADGPSLVILVGAGDGTFADPATAPRWSAAGGTAGMAAVDANGDGKMDLRFYDDARPSDAPASRDTAPRVPQRGRAPHGLGPGQEGFGPTCLLLVVVADPPFYWVTRLSIW